MVASRNGRGGSGTAAPVATDLPERLNFRTARELAEATPEVTEWIVEGLVAVGCITELDAKAKAGKTTKLAHMMAAILAGDRFLDRGTKPTPIVYLTEERPATIRAVLARSGLLAADDLHILSLHDARRLEWPEVMLQVEQCATSVGARLIVVDTLPRWAKLPGDEENNAGAAAEAITPVENVAAHGFGVLMTRHDRKSGGELGDSARGSSAFAGAADIILHLTRATSEGHETRRKLEGVGRFDEVPATLLIELRDGRYVVLGDALEVERTEAKRQLLDMLPDAGATPITEDEIRERIPTLTRSTFQRARDELLAERQIERLKGYGKTGRAFGYRLPSKSTAHIGLDPGQLDYNSVGDHVSDFDVANPTAQGYGAEQLIAPNPCAQPPILIGQLITSERGES
jgi:hypothetical protein